VPATCLLERLRKATFVVFESLIYSVLSKQVTKRESQPFGHFFDAEEGKIARASFDVGEIGPV